MDAPATIILSLIAIGLSVLTFVRLNRAHDLSDDEPQGDCRTAALCNQIHAHSTTETGA